MSSRVKKSSLIPCVVSFGLVLAATCACTSAVADEQLHTEKVKFLDLNVNTPDGVKALYSRIHSAAKHVCFDTDPVLWTTQAACVRDSEAAAIEKVRLPQLTAYYRQQSGERKKSLIASR